MSALSLRNVSLPTPATQTITDQDWTNKRASAQALRAAEARQESGRRRFVDPTTCERDYSQAEIEFMKAMQEYKKQSGRMFPTWSEVLEVLCGMGYEKPSAEQELVFAAKSQATKPIAHKIRRTSGAGGVSRP
jgi:hypothetical protein